MKSSFTSNTRMLQRDPLDPDGLVNISFCKNKMATDPSAVSVEICDDLVAGVWEERSALALHQSDLGGGIELLTVLFDRTGYASDRLLFRLNITE